MSAVPLEARGIYRLGVLVKPSPAGEKAPRVRKTKRKSGFQGALLSDQAKWVWLQLRDQGGWWTAGEVGRLPGCPTTPGQYTSTVASRWLAALEARGHVRLNPLAIRVRGYGVTSSCTPIPGFSMEPGDTSHALPDVFQPNPIDGGPT